jgi:hypothetical protein
MMNMQHPEAFLFVPLWLAAMWLFPRAGFGQPLRVGIGVLLLLAWLNPELERQSRGLDVWALLDRSSSASGLIEPRLPEIEALLEQHRGPHDRLFLVDYADEAIRRDPVQSALLSGRRDATRTASALHFALGQLAPRRAARLLLVTDGFSTEPLDDMGARLLAAGVPLDVRLLVPPAVDDVRVEALSAPVRTRPGEPFIVEARIAGTSDGDVPCVLLRDGAVAGRAVARVRGGRAAVRWTDLLSRPGAARFEVRVEPEKDAWPGNNQRAQWVEAQGGQRVLLITAYRDDPWGEALAADGIAVETVTDPSNLRPGHLAGCALVILNNVPAYHLPNELLEALPFYVTEQGGGLIMAGGKTSFAAGGYFESAVDPLLPVSMELKQEHRKLAVAMAIVMDRSGSMTAGVAGGGGLTKMDLANAGAARAIELLGPRDAITVFAVDSEAHRVLPLTTLGDNREAMLDIVRRIQSAGGGIFVYNGLRAGWDELQKADQGQRHLILFADAADSEEATGFERLVDEMRAGNATLSVIALGTEQDADADLLKAIAARGGGRILFNADAATLPQLFAQETVALSRSAFLTDPIGLVPAAGWLEIAAEHLPWPAQVDGYNLNYLRPGAAASLLSADEYEAPLLAQWTRGVGRVGAICFPTAGDYSRTLRAWPSYADFLRTFTRWALRDDAPPGIAVRIERMGETVRARLYHDETWSDAVAATPPVLVTEKEGGAGGQFAVWQRMEAGAYVADLDLPEGQTLHGVVRIGRTALPFGPVMGDAGAEWRFDPAMPAALRTIAALSGGGERADLTTIWDAPRRREAQGLRPPLLVAALVVFLLEALLARLGWQRPARDRGSRTPPVRGVTPPVVPKPPVVTHEPERLEGTDIPDPTTDRRRAFTQARQRGRL